MTEKNFKISVPETVLWRSLSPDAVALMYVLVVSAILLTKLSERKYRERFIGEGSAKSPP